MPLYEEFSKKLPPWELEGLSMTLSLLLWKKLSTFLRPIKTGLEIFGVWSRLLIQWGLRFHWDNVILNSLFFCLLVGSVNIFELAKHPELQKTQEEAEQPDQHKLSQQPPAFMIVPAGPVDKDDQNGGIKEEASHAGELGETRVKKKEVVDNPNEGNNGCKNHEGGHFDDVKKAGIREVNQKAILNKRNQNEDVPKQKDSFGKKVEVLSGNSREEARKPDCSPMEKRAKVEFSVIKGLQRIRHEHTLNQLFDF